VFLPLAGCDDKAGVDGLLLFAGSGQCRIVCDTQIVSEPDKVRHGGSLIEIMDLTEKVQCRLFAGTD
jgi:hypothetical protein